GGNGLNMVATEAPSSQKGDRVRIASFLIDAGLDPRLEMRGGMTHPGAMTPLRMSIQDHPELANVLLDRVKYDAKELTDCVSWATSWAPPATLAKLIEKGAVVKDAAK